MGILGITSFHDFVRFNLYNNCYHSLKIKLYLPVDSLLESRNLFQFAPSHSHSHSQPRAEKRNVVLTIEEIQRWTTVESTRNRMAFGQESWFFYDTKNIRLYDDWLQGRRVEQSDWRANNWLWEATLKVSKTIIFRFTNYNYSTWVLILLITFCVCSRSPLDKFWSLTWGFSHTFVAARHQRIPLKLNLIEFGKKINHQLLTVFG